MSSTRSTSFTAGRRMSSCRASCVMFFPACSAVRIAHQRDHRRAGVQRLDQPGREIGRPRPERRIHQPDTARDLGVGIGDEGAGALVVDQVVRQAEPPRGVVERQQLEAAHAEHRAALDAPAIMRAKRLAARHLVASSRSISRAACTIVRGGHAHRVLHRRRVADRRPRRAEPAHRARRSPPRPSPRSRRRSRPCAPPRAPPAAGRCARARQHRLAVPGPDRAQIDQVRGDARTRQRRRRVAPPHAPAPTRRRS